MIAIDKTLIGLTSACALTVCGSAASAGVVDLTFTSTDGSGVDASFVLTTSGDNGFGADDVTALTGSVTGGVGPGAVTSYTPTPGNTGFLTSTDGVYAYDNWVYSGATSAPIYAHSILDVYGPLFDVGGTEYNLFWNFNGPGGYELSATTDGGGATYFGNVSVPEPATWALMLVGFAGLGAAMRVARRERAVSAV